MKAKYEREADLCADFMAWVSSYWPDIKCFAEWAGWDILVAFPDGWQLGIQAKLRLNADVIGQAVPDRWYDGTLGPDFRGILVPKVNGLSGIAEKLGLVVFHPHYTWRGEVQFVPDMRPTGGDYGLRGWLDWNPHRRHDLPPVETTDSVAGSSCPVTLTPWKLGALRVLAELEVVGKITSRRIRELGVDPRLWTQWWLEPTGERGWWRRGEACPRFDEQHPTAYAAALGEAKGVRDANATL